MKRLHVTILLCIFSAWAMPLPLILSESSVPSLPAALIFNLCWRVYDGTEAGHSACHYFGPQSSKVEDDITSKMISNGRALRKIWQPAASKEDRDSGPSRDLSEHSFHGGMVHRRSNDLSKKDTEQNDNGHQTESVTTTTEADKTTETTDTTTTLKTTSSADGSHTKTKVESTATATSAVPSDTTTQSSTHTVSKTEASTSSSTRTTSVSESSTSVVTSTSDASTTTSTSLAPHAATAQAQQTNSSKFDNASFRRSAIAAGVVFGVLSSIAVGCVLGMYFKKAKRAWERHKAEKGLSRPTSNYSVLPLVEDNTTTGPGKVRGSHSRMSDRESIMFAPTHSAKSSITLIVDAERSSHEMIPISTNSENYALLHETTLASQISPSESMEPQYDPAVPINAGNLTVTLPSVVVVPPSPSPIDQTPSIAPLSSAAGGSSANYDQAGQNHHQNMTREFEPALNNRNESSHGSDDPLWLPSIPRSTSPVFNDSDQLRR